MGESEEQRLDEQRWETLRQLEEWLEGPVLLLSALWIVLLVVELTRGLTPFLEVLGLLIWAIFIVDFAVRLLLAPQKLRFLRHNILTALSLVLPALRLFRILRMARLLRLAQGARGGVRLMNVVGSLNRGMRALRGSMRRRGFPYVLLLTTVVTLVGAAGMFALEQEATAEMGFETYGDALWWTGMIMTTLGSAAWPVTGEGRILAFLLSLYAAGVFGYLTAFIASFLIDREAGSRESAIAGVESLEELRREIERLRKEVERISNGNEQE
ncbi:MAG: ion transporter [Spirochaetota bacterium]